MRDDAYIGTRESAQIRLISRLLHLLRSNNKNKIVFLASSKNRDYADMSNIPQISVS